MTRITPNSEEIKSLQSLHRSKMFITVGGCGNAFNRVQFTKSAGAAIGLSKFDKVAVNDSDGEVWITKASDGFTMMKTTRQTLIIYNKALVEWLCSRYNKKAPFRLDVVKSGNALYVRKAVQLTGRKNAHKRI